MRGMSFCFGMPSDVVWPLLFACLGISLNRPGGRSKTPATLAPLVFLEAQSPWLWQRIAKGH